MRLTKCTKGGVAYMAIADDSLDLLEGQIPKKPATNKSFTNFTCPTCKEFVGVLALESYKEVGR